MKPARSVNGSIVLETLLFMAVSFGLRDLKWMKLLLLSKTEVRLSLQSDIDLIAPKCLLEWHL